MDAVQAANSGHPGMPMGAADMATVLFTKYLKYDPADPAWPDYLGSALPLVQHMANKILTPAPFMKGL